MERGGRIHRYRKHAKQQATSAAISGKSPVQANTNNQNKTNANTGSSSTGAPHATKHQSGVREQDQYMPIANVIRIMRRILPPHAKISDDAKETIQECVSEYISFITGEANDRCQREQRKTITAEDVIWSMGKLGFDNYVEPLTLFLSRYRDSESERSSLRDPILKRSSNHAGAVDYGNVGSLSHFVPPYPMFPPPGVFDAPVIGGYIRDVSDHAPTTPPPATAAEDLGCSSSSTPDLLAHYDPFAQFK